MKVFETLIQSSCHLLLTGAVLTCLGNDMVTYSTPPAHGAITLMYFYTAVFEQTAARWTKHATTGFKAKVLLSGACRCTVIVNNHADVTTAPRNRLCSPNHQLRCHFGKQRGISQRTIKDRTTGL